MIEDYVEYLLEDELKIDNNTYRFYRHWLNIYQNEEELNIILNKLLEFKIDDPIAFGFNYSSRDIIKKIKEILDDPKK